MTSRRIILIFILLEISILIIAFAMHGVTLLALQTATRFSGRLSLFVFSGIFLLHSEPGKLRSILSAQFYSVFAIVHGIHLILLLLFVLVADIPLVPVRVAGGFLAYLFIFLMPLLSHKYATGRITEKKFFTIEIIFLYYVWFVFFMTYLPRVQGKLPLVGGKYIEHVALLGWVSLLMGYKLGGLLSIKRQR